ncbi:AI-2E family transporter [Methanoregula sp.]|jgi:predicted PurR-regulated permease PerM|uniref:AI-2E family transporter n=1 Tax=Methanoregula sp. TaxID=2052170 RepID=UPI003C19B6C5
MTFSPTRSGTERILLWLALIVIIIYGVRMTSPVITILLVSLVLSLLLYPATAWLQKKGLSVRVSVGVVIVAALLCIVLVLFLTISSFEVILVDLPQYHDDLTLRLADTATLLSAHGINPGYLVSQNFNLVDSIQTMFSSLMNIGGDFMDLFFIAVTTCFMLLEAPPIIERIKVMLAGEPEKLRKLARMSGFVVDFMIVRTETNVFHGVLFGGVLAIMGVHAALLWGILTFFLCYIPYFGLILAAIPAIFFAWLQFGIWGVVAVIALVCILNLIVENPVFSYLAARRFEIPALVVILSVIFWGWLLGFAGMLFSIPFTLMVATLFEFSDELSWINVLLGLERLFEDSTVQPDMPTGDR